MKINIIHEPKSVVVITPTVGSSKLVDAGNSVRHQSYKTDHLLVVDGPSRHSSFVKDENEYVGTEVVTLSQNTGANGFYGHRIYAAFPHLVNQDYIAFLDEDNWYKPDHISSLVETLEKGSAHFAYSLRSIYNADKTFACDDNCESLGEKPTWVSSLMAQKEYLIDTSSFLFKRDWIQRYCHLWHSGWGGDRRFLALVKQDSPVFRGTGKHTLCYRLDGNKGSVTADFFEKGNEFYRIGGQS